MKYYHVIYTSSQKNLNGSNGFGIRTATEGIPQAYLRAVDDAVNTNLITNDVSDCKVPSPKELLDDGHSILSVPPRYFYLKLDVEGSAPLFAVGRNIELGFTELFYYKDKDGNISGKGGRTGNFLIDLYLFEERPQRDVFQIFSDNSFIPADPSPSVNNLEMASIATGDPVPFPVTEIWPLQEGNELPQEKAVDLLFLLLEGRFSSPKKNIVAKYPWQQTHALISDAMKLLPNDFVGDFTFSTNYSGSGYVVPAELNFVNEYYNSEFEGNDLFVDLTNYTPQTNESNAYRQLILDALRKNDLKTVRELFGWLLSDSYKKVCKLNPHTNQILFIYSQKPEQFSLSMLHENKKEDSELLENLGSYINESPKSNSRPFVDCLEKDLDTACSVEREDEHTAQDMCSLVERLEIYSKYISLTKSVINEYSSHIEEVLLSNPVRAIERLGAGIVKKYTNNLANAIDNQGLAPYLFEDIKAKLPHSLEEAKGIIDKYKINPKVFELLINNFSALFGGLYEQTVRETASYSDKKSIAKKLNDCLMDPLQDAHDNSDFKKFELLYEVLNETAEVDSSNYKDVLKLLKDTGMLNSSLAKKVKEQLFNASNERDIKESVNTLVEYWQLKYTDIISQLPSTIEEQTKKLFVRAALDKNPDLNINEVIKYLKDNNFSESEIEEFLSHSNSFASAYNSLKRKNAISNFFKGLLKLFTKKHEHNKDSEITKSKKVDERNKTNEIKSSSNEIKPEPTYNLSVFNGLKNQMNTPRYQKIRSDGLNNPKFIELHDKLRDYLESLEGAGEKIPDKYKDFWKLYKKSLSMWLIIILFSVFGSLNASAAGQDSITYQAYGDAKNAPTCYIVTTKTLNVRTSPSLYKGKRKKKRKDNLAFQMNKGDTVFISTSALSETVDKIEWIAFSNNGQKYYTNLASLQRITNPRYVPKKNVDVEVTEGLLGFTKNAAPWMLLIFTVIVFFITFAVVTPDKDSIRGEARTSTGMRPIFIYSLRPYKFFAGLSLRVAISGLASVFILLAIGGAIWGVLWIVKILLWILIILGWILLVVGVGAIFAKEWYGVIALAIGGIIVYYQDFLIKLGEECVATGFAYLEALNVWDFSYELVKRFWFEALVASLIPIVLFLAIAVLLFIVAGLLRAYDFITTKRYDINHECPICHKSSQPTKYFDSRGNALPCALRPGIYGLLHITHPATGVKLPTMLANGRDKYKRECPHCGQAVQFKLGTDKHIGFIGMPGAGKTALLSSILGELQYRLHNNHQELKFTGKVDKDIKDCANYVAEVGQLDENHLPRKTRTNKTQSSIQCIYPRSNGKIPYVLYFNDVSGESFVAENYDKELLRFSKDVENLLFIVDPLTMSFDMNKISDSMKKWLKNEDIQIIRNDNQRDIDTICYSMINALKSSERDLGRINFTFVLVKSDIGYLNGVDVSSQETARHFMISDMGLGNLIDNAESQFKSVSYVAVSVFNKRDEGIQSLCDSLIQQLELE